MARTTRSAAAAAAASLAASSSAAPASAQFRVTRSVAANQNHDAVGNVTTSTTVAPPPPPPVVHTRHVPTRNQQVPLPPRLAAPNESETEESETVEHSDSSSLVPRITIYRSGRSVVAGAFSVRNSTLTLNPPSPVPLQIDIPLELLPPTYWE